CTLALSPYIVTRYPKASAISSPPRLLRLLPAGAIAGWDLHPLESAAFPRRTGEADMMQQPVVVVEAEQQRTDERTAFVVAKAADHAVDAAVVLDLLHAVAIARAV